jgi:dsRNA-specific ribonuclease
MRPHRLGKWGTQILAPGARQSCLFSRSTIPTCRARLQSTVATQETAIDDRARWKDELSRIPDLKPLRSSLASVSTSPSNIPTPPPPPFASPAKSRPLPQTSELNFGRPPPPPEPSRYYSPEELPSPPVEAALKSAKLSALHARLGLSSRLPLETLSRALIHVSADKDGRFNNYGLVTIGDNLLSYYMSEHLLVHYPRLPMAVLQAAQFAYTGPPALMTMSQEWGVEAAAEPGGEVNPGYLQFKRVAPGTPMHEDDAVEKRARLAALIPGVAKSDGKLEGATLEVASSAFVRALFAAVYLHTGAAATHEFFKAHILSRQLDLASLFTFTQPTRDLARLCAREGFEAPVARVISETGRLSRHPVFVVGVFSGRDKLGEAGGASLNEARFKASIKALKSWYLYSPQVKGGELMVPSAMEGVKGKGRTWKPAYIDDGEIIV